MIYLELFKTFFILGLFGFGGGYAIVPLMEHEIMTHGWLDVNEFANIVSVSQMTPGPIAINAATYIGFNSAPFGLLGAFCASFGVVLPSFILIILIANVFDRFNKSSIFQSVLKGIRPVTIGLISSAVWFFASISIFTLKVAPIGGSIWAGTGVNDFLSRIHISPGGVIIAIVILISRLKFKIHPIFAIILSALLGIFII